jgi:hypothetical protein
MLAPLGSLWLTSLALALLSRPHKPSFAHAHRQDENRHGVLVFRRTLRARHGGLDQSSTRNVRAANELMRAAAGQGQNKDGYNL